MRSLVLAAALLVPVGAASAQPGWRSVPAGPAVTVDGLYALGDDLVASTLDPATGELVEGATIGAVAVALVVGARVPVARRVSAVAEVPFAYASFDFPEGFGGPALEGFDTDGADVGNPYLGVEVQARAGLVLSGGVRLPVADADLAAGVPAFQGGLTTDAERFEAYLPDTFAALAAVALTGPLGDALRFRLRAEPALLVSTTDRIPESGNESDLALGYAAGVEADAGPATLSGGLYGRQVLTSGPFDLFDRAHADLATALGATVDVGGVRPGFAVRVPLGDAIGGQDATVGFSLDVPLGRR